MRVRATPHLGGRHRAGGELGEDLLRLRASSEDGFHGGREDGHPAVLQEPGLPEVREAVMSTGHLWCVKIYRDSGWVLRYRAVREVRFTRQPPQFYWTLRGARRASKRWLRQQKERQDPQAVEVHT